MIIQTPRDVIAGAIYETPSPQSKFVIIKVDHSLTSRRLIAEHAMSDLAAAGYSVVPTAEWERLAGSRRETRPS